MNEEIKKILKKLKNISTPTGISYSGDITINNDDVKILEDYITNLQQEIEKLNNIINELENDFKKRKHTYENMNASINGVAVGCFTYVLKKLQELKDSD